MEVSDLYREYRWCRMFPQSRDFDTELARRTDWFLQFERIDRETDAKREAERWKAVTGGR